MATWPNTWCKSGRFIRLLFSRESESCVCETSSTVFGKPVRSTQKNASDWVWAKSTKMVERKKCEFFIQIDIPKIWVKVTSSWGGILFSQNHMQTHALRGILHLFVVEKYSTITPHLAVLFLVSLAKHSWVWTQKACLQSPDRCKFIVTPDHCSKNVESSTFWSWPRLMRGQQKLQWLYKWYEIDLNCDSIIWIFRAQCWVKTLGWPKLPRVAGQFDHGCTLSPSHWHLHLLEKIGTCLPTGIGNVQACTGS